MTYLARRFDAPQITSLETVIETAETLSGHGIETDRQFMPKQIEVWFSGFPEESTVTLQLDREAILVSGSLADTHAMVELLTASLMDLGAAWNGTRPELPLPLTRKTILDLNREFEDGFMR